MVRPRAFRACRPTERHAGKDPANPIANVRKLLASMDTSHIVGLRDRAILAVMVYTTSRRNAAKLKRSDFYHSGQQ